MAIDLTQMLVRNKTQEESIETFGLYYKLAYICIQEVGRNASNINFPLFKAIDGL